MLELWRTARSAAAATPDTPEALELLLEAGGLFVAEVDGAVVGTLIAAWDGWRGNMYRLAVEPGRRRRGIARALVDAGHAYLRSRGARRVTALVGRGQEEAAALWLAAGYEVDDVDRHVRNL